MTLLRSQLLLQERGHLTLPQPSSERYAISSSLEEVIVLQ